MTAFTPGDRVRVLVDANIPRGVTGTVDKEYDSYVSVRIDGNTWANAFLPSDLERIPEEPMTTTEITAEWIEEVGTEVEDMMYRTRTSASAAIKEVIGHKIAPKPRVFRVTIPAKYNPTTDQLRDAIRESYISFADVEEITE
jgi:hypothetical protein